MGHRPQIYHSSGYRAGRSIRSYFLHGPMRIITLIIIHCSATPQGVSLSFEDCRHDHIFHRNFRDIGYHFYLTRDGGLDSNHKPSDTRTLPQKASLVALLRELKQMFPNVLVVGHHDLNPMKECPCFNAVTEYRGL